MVIEGKSALRVQLVLASVLRRSQKAVAPRDLEGEPCCFGSIGWAPAGDKVVITSVGAELNLRFEARLQVISDGKIHCVVAVTHIECAAIDVSTCDQLGDQEIRVGIAISMR